MFEFDHSFPPFLLCESDFTARQLFSPEDMKKAARIALPLFYRGLHGSCLGEPFFLPKFKRLFRDDSVFCIQQGLDDVAYGNDTDHTIIFQDRKMP
ncbi:MAG: hypothetical protein N3A02_06095, partial [Rectinema sp.]|nr:hypothetical protein [Rectinema sp.]